MQIIYDPSILFYFMIFIPQPFRHFQVKKPRSNNCTIDGTFTYFLKQISKTEKWFVTNPV